MAGETVGAIGSGIVALTAFAPDDSERDLRWMTEKLAGMRIFADDQGRMNKSVEETGGEVLVVSQFTLYGDVSRGRRPSFLGSAGATNASSLYTAFVELLQQRFPGRVQTGRFGAVMELALVNDGPVTLIVDC